MNNSNELRFLPCGDSAVTVQFAQEMSEQTNRRIRFVAGRLEQARIPGILECVPTFCSLTVYFDPLRISGRKLQKTVEKLAKAYREDEKALRRVFMIPVCYENRYS